MIVQRDTHQRKVIRDLLCEDRTHPTADEVYERAREVLPNISRGTVYRNLGVLSENGEILHLKVPVGPDHYDSTLTGHYHFLCRCCHRMQDTSLPYQTEWKNRIPDLAGCEIEDHQLLFLGICKECKERGEA